MLVDEIKKRITEAMKAKSVDKEVLRVALGEIQTQEARTEKAFTDDEAMAVVRKLVKSNRETLDATTDATKRAELEREIVVLESLLPKTLSVDEIVAALAPVKDALVAAGNEGQATGVAMKHLKTTGSSAGGKDVAAAVKRMRNGG